MELTGYWDLNHNRTYSHSDDMAETILLLFLLFLQKSHIFPLDMLREYLQKRCLFCHVKGMAYNSCLQ